MPAPVLTFKRANDLLSFDGDTGVLRWRRRATRGAVAGCLAPDGYVKVKVDQRQYQAHRVGWLLATGSWPDGELDHADGDRSNNKLSNLRPATSAENKFNTGARRNNKCGLKGVCFSRGKWRADIRRQGAKSFLGYFPTAAEAAGAYANAAVSAHGDFAFHKSRSGETPIRSRSAPWHADDRSLTPK